MIFNVNSICILNKIHCLRIAAVSEGGNNACVHIFDIKALKKKKTLIDPDCFGQVHCYFLMPRL
jgi:hypothetical protein